MASLRAGVDIARRAGVAGGRQLAEAERALVEARAAELRAEAEGLRREAAGRQAVTDEMLGRLREHEGCDFVPFVSPDAGLLATMGEPVIRSVPLTSQLLGRAAALDDQASAMLAQLAVVPAPV